MTDSTTRFGVAHPTVVPLNNGQHGGDDDREREATDGGAPA